MDEMLLEIEKRYSQENLSLIIATGHTLQLRLDSNDISILHEKFNLDSLFECFF